MPNRDTRHWPPEFRRHLYPLTAADLHAFTAAFIFMTAADLEAERATIAGCLPAPGHTAPPGPQQALALAEQFGRLAPFGTPPSAASLRCALAPLPDRKSRALAARLEQLRWALQQATHHHGADYDPTEVFVVAPLWRQRWESLIEGALYPAYIGCLLADRF